MTSVFSSEEEVRQRDWGVRLLLTKHKEGDFKGENVHSSHLCEADPLLPPFPVSTSRGNHPPF